MQQEGVIGESHYSADLSLGRLTTRTLCTAVELRHETRWLGHRVGSFVRNAKGEMMTVHLSRRRFLAASSVACAAREVPRLSLAADKERRVGRLSDRRTDDFASQICPAGGIRHLQGMGVHYVEFSASSHLPATATDEQIATARQLAAAAD